MTTSIAGITIEDGDDGGTIEEDTAGQIQTAVEAVNTTMGQITNLKEAEGLSDTVVDAIGILENAWNELREVRLGNGAGTAVSDIDDTEIENVTQEQVGMLKEDKDIDYTVN